MENTSEISHGTRSQALALARRLFLDSFMAHRHFSLLVHWTALWASGESTQGPLSALLAPCCLYSSLCTPGRHTLASCPHTSSLESPACVLSSPPPPPCNLPEDTRNDYHRQQPLEETSILLSHWITENASAITLLK